MLRRWRAGRGRRHVPLILALIGALGLGWVFGSRVLAIHRTGVELRALASREERLVVEIGDLRRRLAEAGLPAVVEREARRKLRWGFPDEERIVILRR